MCFQQFFFCASSVFSSLFFHHPFSAIPVDMENNYERRRYLASLLLPNHSDRGRYVNIQQFFFSNHFLCSCSQDHACIWILLYFWLFSVYLSRLEVPSEGIIITGTVFVLILFSVYSAMGTLIEWTFTFFVQIEVHCSK